MSKDRDITIFIGNGIGMELNSLYFSLKSTLECVWKDFEDKNFEDKNFEDKNFIEFCKKINGGNLPDDEEGFAKVHLFFEGLRSIEFSKDHIQMKISDEIAPADISAYLSKYDELIQKVTKHFFDYPISEDQKCKNDKFMKNLKEFIKDNHKKGIKTHVITTNYDKLLYASFCDEKDDAYKVFEKNINKSPLIDGFYRKKGDDDTNKNNKLNFDIKNFYVDGKNNEFKTGVYLPIHGSPLFFSDINGEIYKLTTKEMSNTDTKNINENIDEKKGIKGRHLVLCETSKKLQKIISSSLLRSYFEVFKQGVRHSEKVIIIGYSGLDSHIMDVFKSAAQGGCKFYIVENEEKGKGEQHWKNALGIEDSSYLPKHWYFPKLSIFDFNINDIQ